MADKPTETAAQELARLQAENVSLKAKLAVADEAGYLEDRVVLSMWDGRTKANPDKRFPAGKLVPTLQFFPKGNARAYTLGVEKFHHTIRMTDLAAAEIARHETLKRKR